MGPEFDHIEPKVKYGRRVCLCNLDKQKGWLQSRWWGRRVSDATVGYELDQEWHYKSYKWSWAWSFFENRLNCLQVQRGLDHQSQGDSSAQDRSESADWGSRLAWGTTWEYDKCNPFTHLSTTQSIQHSDWVSHFLAANQWNLRWKILACLGHSHWCSKCLNQWFARKRRRREKLTFVRQSCSGPKTKYA